MKFSIALGVMLGALAFHCQAQSVLTLQECYALANANYPLTKKNELLQQSKAYSVLNASTGRLPQITVGGQATYQSDVTRIPVEMPGVQVLSKDQYRLWGEVSETLYHGGLVSARAALAEANGEADEQALRVELYQLQNRINELFFGILLLEDQIIQTNLGRDDLQAALRKVEASVANGTALRSAADVLRAELLRLGQRVVEMESSAAAYRQVLGIFINRELSDDTKLAKPSYDQLPTEMNRPELRLFELQRQALAINERVLSAGRKPRLELFVQGGYGRPGLNMLENEFNFYYIGGVRLSWLLSGYYTFRREKQLLEVRRQGLDVEQDSFEFNTNLELVQRKAEVEKLQRLIEVDDGIIALRTNVRKTAEAQLEEGVISATEFVREVNAEDQAKQNRALHGTQLLLAQAKYQFAIGQ